MIHFWMIHSMGSEKLICVATRVKGISAASREHLDRTTVYR
jgi:hypothetical protein